MRSEIESLTNWVNSSDRRKAVLSEFSKQGALRPIDIASSVDRSVQNVSLALSELSKRNMIKNISRGQRTWKKYELTYVGELVLHSLLMKSNRIVIDHVATKLSMKYVKDAYKLILDKPLMLKKGTPFLEAVKIFLSEPRTRNAYVVDGRSRLIGIITLRRLLSAIDIVIASKNDASRGQSVIIDNLAESIIDKVMLKPISVRENELLSKALKKMLSNDLADIPVIDGKNRLIGDLNGTEMLLLGIRMLEEDLLSEKIQKS
jgi:CBS domain-containing protein